MGGGGAVSGGFEDEVFITVGADGVAVGSGLSGEAAGGGAPELSVEPVGEASAGGSFALKSSVFFGRDGGGCCIGLADVEFNGVVGVAGGGLFGFGSVGVEGWASGVDSKAVGDS